MTNRHRVRTWPSYLLTKIPAELVERLHADAAAADVSVTDVVRRLLCGRYRLECRDESYHYSPRGGTAAGNLLLRLQPKLTRALLREVRRSGRTRRDLILETIEDHYNGRESS